MTGVYIANLAASDQFIRGGPPLLDDAFTAGTEVHFWPTGSISDQDLPQRDDYIIFANLSYKNKVQGIGQVHGVSHGATAEQILAEHAISVDKEDSSIVTVVNYESLPRKYRPQIQELFEEVSDDFGGDEWLSKVPESVLQKSDFIPPLRGFAQIDDLDITRFKSSPGSPGGSEPPYEGFEEGGDGDGVGIDRTGPLLAQQYTGRDALRSASKDTLQMTILLFGVIVAGFSFLRKALKNGVVTVSDPLIAGGLSIGVGAVLAGTVFVLTVVKPRPLADSLSQFHNDISAATIGNRGSERTNRLIALSERYHKTVQTIRSSNAILGALIGAALGSALLGIFLMASEIISQYPADYRIPAVGTILLIGIAVALTGYSVFQAANTYSES